MRIDVFLTLWLVSLPFTLFIWWKVLRSNAHKVFKAVSLLVSAIPVLGPVFYLLIDMPNRLPAHLQAPPLNKGTRPYSETARWIQDAELEHRLSLKRERKKNRATRRRMRNQDSVR
jgi:hypothetical protein